MKKGDFVIIAACAVLFIVWGMVCRGGETVSIYVNGELYKSVPLTENAKILVKSEFGENTVTVKNGQVYISDSNCPRKQCQRSKISKTANSLVCLPNRLTVIIEGGKNTDETDVVM